MEEFYLSDLIECCDNQIRSQALNVKYSFDLPITIYALAKGESISREYTLKTKIIYIVDGCLELSCEVSTRSLNKGQVIIIPPEQVHSLFAKSVCKFLQIETT